MSCITVITPCYNMDRYLERTIDSVLQNLKPGDEYFIIDGGSTDDSVSIIESYGDQLTGWVSEKDRGYADALAKGFERAKGDIFCWINASDLLLAGALDAAREFFEKKEIDLIFGDDFYIDEKDGVISFSRGSVKNLRASMLYGGWTPLQDACFWRQSLYKNSGGIDVNLQYAADYDLFLRMSGLGRSVYVATAFSAFRQHHDQKSIHGMKPYKKERMEVRTRELNFEAVSSWKKTILTVWHAVALRWRIYISQKFWKRTDIKGCKVQSLSAGQYWPCHKDDTK